MTAQRSMVISQARCLASPLGLAALAAAALCCALAVSVSELAPSLATLLGGAIVTLVVPLFWPGAAVDARATVARCVLWGLASGVLAFAAVLVMTRGAHSWPHTGLVVLTAASLGCATAAFASALQPPPAPRAGAGQEAALLAAVLVLWTLAASPALLAPVTELLHSTHPSAASWVVGISPLSQLAVAAGNDLLRNDWFYAHSGISGLAFEYPSLALAWAAHLAIAALAWLMVFARRASPVAQPH